MSPHKICKKGENIPTHTKILGNLWPNFVSWQIRLATLYEVLQSFLCTLIPLNDVYFNDSNFRSNEHISKFFYSYRTKVIPCPKPNLSNFVVNIFGGEAALPAQTSPLGYSLSQFAISVLDLQAGTPFPLTIFPYSVSLDLMNFCRGEHCWEIAKFWLENAWWSSWVRVGLQARVLTG